MNRFFNVFVIFCLILITSSCNYGNEKQNDLDHNLGHDLDNNITQTFRISQGIEVSMVAPSGFKLSHEHYGFTQIESFSRIKISEIEIPYSKYLTNISKENLLINQLQLIKKEPIEVGGALCTLLTLRQNIAGAYFEKLWLIAGDKLSVIQIEASYPEGSPKSHKQAIKKSLLTFTVATDDQHRIYTGLPFKLAKLTNFTVKQRHSNSVVLLPTDATDSKTSVVISHGITKKPIESIQELSEHFLNNSQSLKNIDIRSNEMIKLNKIPALVTISHAQIKDEMVWVYQVVSYQKEKFLLIQGQTPLEQQEKLANILPELLNNFEFR